MSWPLLPASLSGNTRAILAWDIGVGVYLLLAYVLFFTVTDPRQMAENAEAQEEGEWTIFWLTVAAIIASFATIVGEFAEIKTSTGAYQGLHVVLVVMTLVVSWLMAHTSFAYRYAHEYYEVSVDGAGYRRGLDFPNEEHPDYLDFCYFAIVLGMTFQVSDVSVSDRHLRRLTLVHSVLAFLFNTIILALTVNLAAGLL